MDDIELLQEFASQRSEEAFRAVVERHIDFVYAVALRQLSDAHAAEEVTQEVLIDLARKAAAIPRETVLSGWLFRAARFAAAKSARSETRRQRREWEATQMEPTVHANETESVWEHMEPMLNEALAELSEKDRSAVLLRFFEKKPLKDIGKRLGLNEDAGEKTRRPRRRKTPAHFPAARHRNVVRHFSGSALGANRAGCPRRTRRQRCDRRRPERNRPYRFNRHAWERNAKSYGHLKT